MRARRKKGVRPLFSLTLAVMPKQHFEQGYAAGLLVLLSACTQPEAPAPAETATDVLTLDSHVDIDLEFATDAIDPLDADIQANLQKMQEGGLDAAFFIVYVGQTERTAENYRQAAADAMTKFDAIHRMTSELYPDLIGLAYRADDVERLVGEGRLAAAIGIENGYVMSTDLEQLERYYELGARYMTLVHNGHNDIADSAQPKRGARRRKRRARRRRDIRRSGDSTHERARDDGRYLARLEANGARCNRAIESAGHCFTFERSRTHRSSPQP